MLPSRRTATRVGKLPRPRPGSCARSKGSSCQARAASESCPRRVAEHRDQSPSSARRGRSAPDRRSGRARGRAGAAGHPRVRRARVSRLLLEADQPDHLVDRSRVLVVARELREMLGDREVFVHGRRLEHDADPPSPVEIRTRRIGAQHLHFTRIALSVALDDLDRRRLAGAVRTEQTEDLAGAELEARCPSELRTRRRTWSGPRTLTTGVTAAESSWCPEPVAAARRCGRGKRWLGPVTERGRDLAAVGLVPDD